MKKSTKSRLTEKQIAVFPSNSLFDKIARAVCRAGTLPGKELFEAWEVARRVRRKYRGGRVIDLNPDDIAVSVHACGQLTDTIIETAVNAGARLAVLPCCHDTNVGDLGGLGGWVDGPLAIDVTRAALLRAKGYSVITRTIPEEITPKNRLLMAHPKLIKG